MTEPERRTATAAPAVPISLLLVLVVAALLRFWGLGAGIPYAIGADEPEIVDRVVAMMKSGDFNPHFFDYPGLIFYMHLVVAVARFLTGALGGAWSSLAQVGPADFYLWGRALTAAFGVGTVFLLYLIGGRWGTRHGLLAAALLAVMPMHVRESHFTLADVPATFFCTLTMLAALVAHERATVRHFLWAGAAAGLAVGAKYNAGVVLILPLVAAWMTPHDTLSRVRGLLAVFGGAIGMFLIVAPYTVLDLPAFLDGFAHLVGYYRPRPPHAESGWILYFKHLRMTMGWPATGLLAAGLVLGIVRAIKGPGQTRWILLVAFPVFYFVLIGNRSLIYGRYLLPLLPFASLLAAIAVVSGVSLLRRLAIPHVPRRALIVALTVAALLPPLVGAIRFSRRMAGPTTQDVAWRFVRANLPEGSRVLVEKYDLRLPSPRWQVTHVVRLTDRELDDYVRDGYEYMIATSQVFGPAFEAPHQVPDLYAAYRRLFDPSQEILRVKPDRGRSGPELRIYRLPPQLRQASPGAPPASAPASHPPVPAGP